MKALLKRTLKDSFPLKIIYQSKDNQFSKRTILVKAVNDTYINAYCLSKKQARIFRVDLILAAEAIQKRKNRFYA